MLRGRSFFFQAEDGIRDLVRSRGLGDVYKRQIVAMAFDKVTEAAPDERRRIVNAAKAAVGRCAFLSLIHI